MKKLNKIIISILLISILSVCLFACFDNTTNNTGSGDQQSTMTLVVLNGDNAKEYNVDLSKFTVTNGLLSVLDYLVSIEELTYTANSGFLTQVNDLVQDAGNGVYLYLYTDVEADYDVTQWVTTKEYNGKTLTSSGVEAKNMHIVANCTIMITTIIYSY